MAAGALAGVYRCKAHGRSFTYDVTWEERDAKVSWTARVAHYQRLVEAGAELVVPDDCDAGSAVKRAVEAWIERFSCANAPPWPA
jgi:hypothetical protein